MENSRAIEDTQKWLSSMVIGLGLCPFAEKVFDADLIRYAVCNSTESSELLSSLSEELQKLEKVSRAECETTILIAPDMLAGFLDFNDFLGEAQTLLEELQLDGTIQIVGFHPQFQFAETAEDAPENYTNRSPHPFLHLLREVSISELTLSREELLKIPERNNVTLNQMGSEKILERLKHPLLH